MTPEPTGSGVARPAPRTADHGAPQFSETCAATLCLGNAAGCGRAESGAGDPGLPDRAPGCCSRPLPNGSPASLTPATPGGVRGIYVRY
jgi:hypothetical protein